MRIRPATHQLERRVGCVVDTRHLMPVDALEISGIEKKNTCRGCNTKRKMPWIMLILSLEVPKILFQFIFNYYTFTGYQCDRYFTRSCNLIVLNLVCGIIWLQNHRYK